MPFTRAQLPLGMPCGVTVLRLTLAHPGQTWDGRGFEWDGQAERGDKDTGGGGVGEESHGQGLAEFVDGPTAEYLFRMKKHPVAFRHGRRTNTISSRDSTSGLTWMFEKTKRVLRRVNRPIVSISIILSIRGYQLGLQPSWKGPSYPAMKNETAHICIHGLTDPLILCTPHNIASLSYLARPSPPRFEKEVLDHLTIRVSGYEQDPTRATL
ncbi:hypothetical protein MGYG_02983 [Nannizzia gypsea CBS 118893]|uniref:Uncharacterized protein n=1 Tax=Arthroderma gypseum (strain ATCC MYA-4604 / CBS 118893) TaxID=535722 RepID=E4UQ56_ARTGP|nr:hypothetical protein MGYG_02983 [Nannizzia gypsea CBS 118893]EFQ99975.1 hypothetical protein MGYG_02983 [Nannizzia gypsea CBS 118893]